MKSIKKSNASFTNKKVRYNRIQDESNYVNKNLGTPNLTGFQSIGISRFSFPERVKENRKLLDS